MNKIKKSNIVVGIDLSLKSLSKILQKEKFTDNSNIFIFDKKGMIIASTVSNKIYDSKSNLFNKIKNNNFSIEKVNHNGNDFLLAINPLIDNQFIAISVPFEVMMKEYNSWIMQTMFIVFLIIIFSFPLAIFFSQKVNKNVNILMKQNELVSNRDFNKVSIINSNIYEFKVLSESLYNMSRDIQHYQESLEELFDSFVKMTANTIDMKSKYTGGHCRRVPVIAEMIAETLSNSKDEKFKDFVIKSKYEYKELLIAAWLHDCGKLTIPEYIVDKSTKLETIYNRIHEIRTRFEVVWRDIEIEALRKQIKGENLEEIKLWESNKKEKLVKDFEFIAKCNNGDYFINDNDFNRIEKISEQTWQVNFDTSLGLSEEEKLKIKNKKIPRIEKLLADKEEHIEKIKNFDFETYKEKGFTMKIPENFSNIGEIYNLTIRKGTLNEEERFRMNWHIIATIQMLENLPFPKELKNVPEYAGAHHEHMVGTGYPRSLKKEDMSIPARILAIADIFEALTASDRPYKKSKTISEALKIMMLMAKEGHIDTDIFNLFIREKIFLRYAEKFMDNNLIDDVDIELYLI